MPFPVFNYHSHFQRYLNLKSLLIMQIRRLKTSYSQPNQISTLRFLGQFSVERAKIPHATHLSNKHQTTRKSLVNLFIYLQNREYGALTANI